MLKILNTLKPFIEDNYRRIHVREFAKLQKISPPTASKLLESLYKDNILKKEIDRQYFCYYANNSSEVFKDLQRLYWKVKLEPLLNYLNEEFLDSIIILFGSNAKVESRLDSDIDIAIITSSKKNLNLAKFEKKYGRSIELFIFRDLQNISEELRHNILNGYILKGSW